MTAARIHIIRVAEAGDGEYEIVFDWRADRREDWQAALAAVKADLPAEVRSYDKDTHQWSVYADANTQLALAMIFPNYWGDVERVRFAQQSLFDEVATA